MPNGPEFRKLEIGFKPGEKPRKEEGVAPVELIDPIGKHLDARKEAKILALRRIPVSDPEHFKGREELIPQLIKGREELISSIEEEYKSPDKRLTEPGLPSPEEVELGNYLNTLRGIESEFKGKKLTPGAEKFIEETRSFLQNKKTLLEKEREKLVRKSLETKKEK